ncbi:GNAT family N-acetyltransferase [Thiobaca trueperi]|uniref:Amino-acid N-acetyltransferase n=1 Tax=Thiobaca trueperi TaxID=127458 RepID=A0A4V2V112_9GAMM|nr:GNAT family N-acetyltransferase [Thiobaca trueperi]TCT19422.1 amino-acid N-acetyltransferase [Thiobaca trueperi]
MTEPLIDEVEAHDPALAAILREAGLPTADLVETPADRERRFFRFREEHGGMIGCIGWEATGQIALLRSLVVAPERRGQGWSRVMTDWALQRLAVTGIADVYVLTTSIEPLARHFGFSRIERNQAPPAIRRSRQFASICPVNAVLMHRCLR